MQHKPPTRKYIMSDDRFMGKASFITDQLSKHLSHFQSFDSGRFSEDFVAKLHEIMQQLSTIASDKTIRLVQAVKTKAMQDALQACIDEIQLSKYFVKKFYKRGSAKYNSFGYPRLAKCRYSPEKMFIFFETFIDIVEREKEKLLAAHYPESKFAELHTLCKELETKRIEQNYAKSERHGITYRRITLLNELWDNLKRVEEVACNFIFQDTPELRKRFRLK